MCQWATHPVQPEPSADEVGKNTNGIVRIDSSITYLSHYRFHSNDYGNGKGFQIGYKTLELFTACGGTHSESSGFLSSPSYPNSYPELADCVYLIHQPKGMYINISFHTIDIDCQGTTSDFLEVRDGNSEKSPLMGRFCGNVSNVPALMQSTQNHLRIRWRRKQPGWNWIYSIYSG